jgi:hypothetical protein
VHKSGQVYIAVQHKLDLGRIGENWSTNHERDDENLFGKQILGRIGHIWEAPQANQFIFRRANPLFSMVGAHGSNREPSD